MLYVFEGVDSEINIEDLMWFLMKNFKSKIKSWTQKQSRDNLGCSYLGFNCLLAFQK